MSVTLKDIVNLVTWIENKRKHTNIICIFHVTQLCSTLWQILSDRICMAYAASISSADPWAKLAFINSWPYIRGYLSRLWWFQQYRMWWGLSKMVGIMQKIFWRHFLDCKLPSQITKFMGPTWGPPGSCRPQMGPMLAPGTLLSGYSLIKISYTLFPNGPD